MALYQQLSGISWYGTPMEWYELENLMGPGMSESDRQNQLQRALAYWTALVPADFAGAARKASALTWIPAELTRMENPPQNTIFHVVPV